MRGHKVREGDNEGYLEGNGAIDGGKPGISQDRSFVNAWIGLETHVHFISPVTPNRTTKVPKDNILGIKEVMRRNFPNSFEVHALSRYRPP
jgi:hypothetical protein